MLPFPLPKGSIPASALASFCKHLSILALALTCPCPTPSPPCSPSPSPPSHLLPAVKRRDLRTSASSLVPPHLVSPSPPLSFLFSFALACSLHVALFVYMLFPAFVYVCMHVCMCLCVSAFCVSHDKNKERTIPVEKERGKKETCTSARERAACLNEKFCHTSSSVSGLAFRMLHLCICVLCVCVCVRACDSGTGSACQRRCFLLATR